MGIVVGVATLVISVLAWRTARRSTEVAEDALNVSQNQLEIAREQSEQHPDLEVSQVDVMAATPAQRTKLRRVQLARAIKEKRSRGESIPVNLEMGAWEQRNKFPEEYAWADSYDGPLPDFGVRVLLVNRGRVAASQITGWLSFNPAHLRPLDFFSDFEDTHYISGGDTDPDRFRVKVGGNEDATLFPSPDQVPRDYLDFAVHVEIIAEELPVTTRVSYEFATPTGYSIRGEHELEVTERQRGFAQD